MRCCRGRRNAPGSRPPKKKKTAGDSLGSASSFGILRTPIAAKRLAAPGNTRFEKTTCIAAAVRLLCTAKLVYFVLQSHQLSNRTPYCDSIFVQERLADMAPRRTDGPCRRRVVRNRS